jgi:DNA-binding transcriptional LysR family regulator
MYDSKLPGLLRELRADWPGIELSLVHGDVQMLYEALLDLRLDIAIIRAPLASPPDALVVRPFVREKLCLALYQQHPLAGVGRSIWPHCALTTGSRLTIRRAPDWSRYLLTPVASRALRRRWRSGLTTSPR